MDLKAAPAKRRKPSQPSTPAHPLRQTSFPPEARSPLGRSPSIDATSHVSGSQVSGYTAGGGGKGGTKKKRGRKTKGAAKGGGDDGREGTPSMVDGKAPTTVSGQGGEDKDAEEDDDDANAEMALEDVVARTQEQKQEEVRLRAMLVEAFDPEQYDRYERWRAAKLSDAVVKRVCPPCQAQVVARICRRCDRTLLAFSCFYLMKPTNIYTGRECDSLTVCASNGEHSCEGRHEAIRRRDY